MLTRQLQKFGVNLKDAKVENGSEGQFVASLLCGWCWRRLLKGDEIRMQMNTNGTIIKVWG